MSTKKEIKNKSGKTEVLRYAATDDDKNEKKSCEKLDQYANKKEDGILFTVQNIRTFMLTIVRKRLKNFPLLSRIIVGWISLVPPNFFVFFVFWKFVVLLFFICTLNKMFLSKIKHQMNNTNSINFVPNKHMETLSSPSLRRESIKHEYFPSFVSNVEMNLMPKIPPMRILHIVTTLSEYNSGTRGTQKGSDRLQETLIPVLKETITSFTRSQWKVDVYLICGFELSSQRKQLVIDALPSNVGLEVWNDATPLGYDRKNFESVQLITRSLARQHRFVIKDKLDQYDFFSVWEDDMYINSHHVQHFLNVTKEINRLKHEAQSKNIDSSKSSTILGSMSYQQLERVFPGFIRVEVLDANGKSQTNEGDLPVDLDFSAVDSEVNNLESIDVEPCCAMSLKDDVFVKHFPTNPTSEQVVAWEVASIGYSVRKFPESSFLGWVALQPGPAHKRYKHGEGIEGYWAGEALGQSVSAKPTPGNPRLFGQQGGFMATRDQIDTFERLCRGEFLPPFTSYRDDGLYMMNVEYWSGGQQLWGDGNGACNLQRILMLQPKMFSKHLIYHTANNKQHTINTERVVKANTLLGQLNHVKKAAIASISN